MVEKATSELEVWLGAHSALCWGQSGVWSGATVTNVHEGKSPVLRRVALSFLKGKLAVWWAFTSW